MSTTPNALTLEDLKKALDQIRAYQDEYRKPRPLSEIYAGRNILPKAWTRP